MPTNKTVKRKHTKKNSKILKNKTRKNKKYGGNFDYITNLTDNEINTLRKYTEGSDFLINKILRIENNYKDLYETMNALEVSDKYKEIQMRIEQINIIDNIMTSKATIANNDLIVYRGTVNKRDDEAYLGINKGYISTSKSINPIEKNSFRLLNERQNCCVYIYTIKKGVPYINLSTISHFGEEHKENQEEILLPRGLKTTLSSIDEKINIHGIPYKTYNVIIELNNQDEYDIEPIKKSPTIIQLIEIFEIIDNLLDISGFFYNLVKNKIYNIDERNTMNDIYDIDDFNEIVEEFIDKFLILTKHLNNLLNDYKQYMNNLIEKFMELEFLKDDDKLGLKKLQGELENMNVNSGNKNTIANTIRTTNTLIIDPDKQHIITLFNNNVKDKEICLEGKNILHCGKEGHWLEKQMGIKHNAKNEPDINGYEMKKSSIKTTLGDFSASEYAFSKNNKRTTINNNNNWSDEIKMTRNEFIMFFGNPNPNKNNRYSWSGSCVPTYNNWNAAGQNLLVLENNDLAIYYSFSRDTRSRKNEFPEFLHNDNIMIAIWKADKMKPHIENKFNKKGFFICKKTENKYNNICFGKPFNFEYFIECIKNKKIIFDSGMYEGNSRNYSQFRGSDFWNELIIEEY